MGHYIDSKPQQSKEGLAGPKAELQRAEAYVAGNPIFPREFSITSTFVAIGQSPVGFGR